MKTWALILSLGAMLAGCVAAMLYAWRAANIEITVFGWAMISVGAVISVLLGGGLMALSFYSARGGWDDRVAPDDIGMKDTD